MKIICFYRIRRILSVLGRFYEIGITINKGGKNQSFFAFIRSENPEVVGVHPLGRVAADASRKKTPAGSSACLVATGSFTGSRHTQLPAPNISSTTSPR